VELNKELHCLVRFVIQKALARYVSVKYVVPMSKITYALYSEINKRKCDLGRVCMK